MFTINLWLRCVAFVKLWGDSSFFLLFTNLFSYYVSPWPHTWGCILAFHIFDLSWLTPICYCSCVTDALKVFNDRRIVRPLYCTLAPTMRTAYAINRQTTYFPHTFNGLPIFVLCLICRPSPILSNPPFFALCLPLLQIAAQSMLQSFWVLPSPTPP